MILFRRLTEFILNKFFLVEHLEHLEQHLVKKIHVLYTNDIFQKFILVILFVCLTQSMHVLKVVCYVIRFFFFLVVSLVSRQKKVISLNCDCTFFCEKHSFWLLIACFISFYQIQPLLFLNMFLDKNVVLCKAGSRLCLINWMNCRV